MNRRRALSTAVSVAALSLGGCLADAREAVSGGSTSETREEGLDETPAPTADPGPPAAEESLGESDDGPIHRLRIRNDGDASHELGVEIEYAASRFEEAYDLDSGAYVAFELAERSDYALTITVDGVEVGDDEAFPYELYAEWFDEPCPVTEVRVDESRFEARTSPDAGGC